MSSARQTCERSWRVISSIVRRPRWTASWRSETRAVLATVRSSSMKAAISTTMPITIAVSSSVSVKPDSSEFS